MVDTTLAIAVVVLSIPMWSDLLTAVVALAAPRHPRDVALDDASEPQRLLVLVPAQNEEDLIVECVRALRGLDYPRDAARVVVVADNCDDRTADLARSEGVECLEHFSPTSRGKPHAIRWALKQVGRSWDAVVIVDADTRVSPDFARALDRCGRLTDRVVQARFAIRNPGETWLTRLADLLNWSTYRFRYPLKQRASLNCPLTGNGMCIGREVLAEYPWDTQSLTENWELYAQYTTGGVTIEYAPTALVLSQEAKTLKEAQVQRRRWTAGRFGVLHHWLGRIVTSQKIGWRQKLDCVCELAAPSPIVHLAAVVVVVGLTAMGPVKWQIPVAAGAVATLLPQTIVTVLAFAVYPSKASVLSGFLRLPVYLVWRSWMLLLTVLRPQDGWRRSPRHIEAGDGV